MEPDKLFGNVFFDAQSAQQVVVPAFYESREWVDLRDRPASPSNGDVDDDALERRENVNSPRISLPYKPRASISSLMRAGIRASVEIIGVQSDEEDEDALDNVSAASNVGAAKSTTTSKDSSPVSARSQNGMPLEEKYPMASAYLRSPLKEEKPVNVLEALEKVVAEITKASPEKFDGYMEAKEGHLGTVSLMTSPTAKTTASPSTITVQYASPSTRHRLLRAGLLSPLIQAPLPAAIPLDPPSPSKTSMLMHEAEEDAPLPPPPCDVADVETTIPPPPPPVDNIQESTPTVVDLPLDNIEQQTSVASPKRTTTPRVAVPVKPPTPQSLHERLLALKQIRATAPASSPPKRGDTVKRDIPASALLSAHEGFTSAEGSPAARLAMLYQKLDAQYRLMQQLKGVATL